MMNFTNGGTLSRRMSQTLLSKVSRVSKVSTVSRVSKVSTVSKVSKISHLKIKPLRCLQDEPISIEIENLLPETDVTLTSRIKDTRGNIFLTNTHYRADKNGSINLSKDASLGGTYKGVFPMGPIAHLQGGPTTIKYLRYLNRNVEVPLVVKFNLLKGHLDAEKVIEVDPNLVLDSVKHKRVYLSPNTQRIPIRKGRIRGTLFIPEGDGPFPGIIDLFGTAGGLIEHRAAQFAARGIMTFSLAYFDYDDLPKVLDELDLAYFEEAADFLLSQYKVQKGKIGVVGNSKGGDLACSLGTFIPVVKAVVCINGLPVNTWRPLRLRDRTIPGLDFDRSRIKHVSPGLVRTLDMMNDSSDFPETHLPLHEADAKFLFVVAKADQNWKTEIETDRAVARMKAHGSTNYEVLKYEGAGHLLEPPYSPFSYSTYHKLVNATGIWGGDPIQHTEAQVDSWSKMIKFLKNVIG